MPKQVLLEFKEYATEVDVEFVRKSVLAIGRCAISIEGAAERCISVLLDLIKTKVNYVVQEAIVVIRDIFRRYPDRYEGVIGTLCNSLDSLDEPDAKASMVWIIGEYADRIDNAEELIGAFLDTFLDEASDVQLQLLTATVKLFLKKPSSGPQNLIQKVLHQATSDTGATALYMACSVGHAEIVIVLLAQVYLQLVHAEFVSLLSINLNN